MQGAEASVNDEAVELFRSGRTQKARSILEIFLKTHPQSVVTRVNLGYMLFAAGEFTDARDAYERAVDLDPSCVQAYHGLASAFDALGEEGRSRYYFDRACRLAPIRKRPYRGSGLRKNVILLCSASIANLNAYAILDDRAFGVTTAFVEYAGPRELPGCDAIFNAISEPERSDEALDLAQTLIASLGVPVINAPASVRASNRENNARRFAGIDAVVPSIRRVRKAALAAGEIPRLANFPAIVRAIGHHDGRHMLLVASSDELVARAAELPGDELLVIEFVDVCEEDGRFRKYRAIVVGEGLYPLHLAVSRRWKVHYVTSDMEESAENRAEDARFLNDPRAVAGERAWSALEAVRKVLQLDYGGIDFGVDREGRAVIFEANASMFVPPVPNDSKWDYRREPTARVVDAVTNLLLEASSKPAGSASASA